MLLSNDTRIIVDADLANLSMDKLIAGAVATSEAATIDNNIVISSNNSIIVEGFNTISENNSKEFSINFAGENLKEYVESNIETHYGRLFKYGVDYDKATGNFNFSY